MGCDRVIGAVLMTLHSYSVTEQQMSSRSAYKSLLLCSDGHEQFWPFQTRLFDTLVFQTTVLVILHFLRICEYK